MLSQKARYALRALVELARADGAQLTSGELALRADAPRKFLEAILLELSRNQIVVSRRGKFGGYTLARPAPEITFAEVIRIIDGPLALAPCVSPRLGFRKCADCSDLDTCTLREADAPTVVTIGAQRVAAPGGVGHVLGDHLGVEQEAAHREDHAAAGPQSPDASRMSWSVAALYHRRACPKSCAIPCASS